METLDNLPDSEPIAASVPNEVKSVRNRPIMRDGDVIVINTITIYFFLTGILFFVAGFAVSWVVASSRADDVSSAARQAVQTAVAGLPLSGGVAAAFTPTDVPRQDIKFDASSPSWGPANAKVTVVEYSDFQCPYCEIFFQQTYPQIRKKYGDQIRFVYQYYPLSGIHPDANAAANAAACADEQGKFWDYHDTLFTNQSDLSHDALIKYAQQVKVGDIAQFTTCLTSSKYQSKVDGQENAGSGYQVSGTPTFFINGNILVGAQTFQTFDSMISAELQQAG
jgi:protein-disulfide isomerase